MGKGKPAKISDYVWKQILESDIEKKVTVLLKHPSKLDFKVVEKAKSLSEEAKEIRKKMLNSKYMDSFVLLYNFFEQKNIKNYDFGAIDGQASITLSPSNILELANQDYVAEILAY